MSSKKQVKIKLSVKFFTLTNLTFKRNNSILAHGLESQSKEDFDNFLELVVELAKKLDKDMNKFLKQTRFPKFDIRLDMNKA